MKQTLPKQHTGLKLIKQLLKSTALLVLFSISVFNGNLYSQNCTVNANVSGPVCANQPMPLLGSGGGLFTGSPTWSQFSGPSVLINNPAAFSTSVTGYSAPNNYVFKLSATCQDGTVVWDTVTYWVRPVTVAVGGPDQTLCPGQTGTLVGNAPTYPGETAQWIIIGTNNGVTLNTPNASTTTFTVSPTASGATTIRYQITSPNGCVSVDDYVVISNPGGVTPVNAGLDQTLNNCYAATQSATLAGSYGGSGFMGQLGTWTVVSGPSIPTFSNPNANNSGVSGLIQGTYVLRWTVAGPCANGYDEVTIVVPAPSADISGNSGSSQVFCDGRNSVVLNGTQPAYINETGLWTQVSGTAGAVFASPTSPSTSVSLPTVPGSYTFRWTITNSLTACNSFADHYVSVFVNPTISANGGNNNVTLGCNTTSITIPYTTTGNGSIYWSIVSGPTTGTYPVIPTPTSQVYASPVTISGLSNPGTYVIRFYAVPGTGGGCATATDDVSVVVSRTPTASNAGTSQFLACNVTTTALAGNVPFVGIGRWSLVSGPGPVTFSDVNVANSAISNVGGLVPGTYRFRWRISAGPMCPATQSTTIIRVSIATPTAALAGPDATVCYGTPYIMQANSPILNETGTWTVTPSAGVTFSNVNNPNAVVNGLAANTPYTFTWTLNNACGSTSDDVVITTTTTLGPVQANAGPNQCLASGTTGITLAGNNPAPGTGVWTQLTGGAATITDNTLFNSTVTGMANGTYTFEWAVSSGGCLPTRDTVMITISPATTAANAGADQNVCGTTVTLAGNNPAVGTGIWTLTNGDDGATIASPTTFNTSVSNLINGVYTFTWSISNGACATTTDNVQIYVSTPPTVANAGPNQIICGANTATLAGNAISTGTGLWSVVSGPNIPSVANFSSPTTGVSGMITGTYTFRWTSSNGAYCPETFDDVTIKVVENANAGPDITVCDVTTVQLIGTIGSTGVWTRISGPNTPTITATGGNTATVTGMITGSYVFNYAVSDIDCAPTADLVNVTISGQPTTPVAGPDQDLCHSGTISLAGNTPVIGIGTWSQIFGPAGATFSPNANTPNATVNVTAPSGTYVFVWTITDGGCSKADQVRVVDYALPTIANAGGDVNPLCGNVVTLTANTPVVGLGAWSQVSTTAATNAVFSSSILPNAQASNLTPVDNLTPGIYTFRWTISSGPVCPPSSDDVVISVFTPPTTPNAGPDNAFCNASSINLQGNAITIGTGTWTKVSGPAVTFANANNPNTQVSLTAAGVYTFQWTAVNGPCSLTDQVVITNYATPTSAFAGTDQQVCEFSGLFLNGNTPVDGTGLWSLQSGPSSVIFVNAALPNTQVLGTVPGTYIFKWTVSNGICTPSNDFVSVTIYKTPTVANAGPNQTFCGSQTSTVMAANTAVTGTGVWSQVSGPNAANIINSASPTTTINSLVRGTYVFRWSISNGTCTPSVSNVTVQVNNCAPTATPNAYTTNKNIPVSGNVLLNGTPDSDPENDPLTVTTTPVVGPANGVVTLNADGTFTYTPNPGFSGTDTFTYEVCDNQTPKLCSNAVVTITVNYVNYPPVAYDNTNTTPEDTPVSGNVLTNGTPDSDPDGDPLTVTSISIGGTSYPINTDVLIPGVGTINVGPTGNYTFTPLPNYNGPVPPIDYTIIDGNGGTDVGTLNITVTPVNDPPVANWDSNTTPEDTPVSGTVVANDSDVDGNLNPASYSLMGTPVGGTVVLNPNGTYTFTPNPNFNGPASFVYQVCDLGVPVYCDTAIVYINVVGVNDPPVAVDDTYTVPEDGTVTLTPLALDSDPDGGTLSIVSINGVNLTPGVAQTIPVPNGTVTITAGGVITFTPDPNYSGTVTFPYVISDGQGGTATANEIINVTPVNDPPVANWDSNTTPEDTPVSGTVVANDSDVDGNLNPVGYSLVTGPTNGTVVMNPNGTYTYTPGPGYFGNDSFIYTVCDLGLPVYCDTAIVYITITPVNDPPVAVDNIYTTPEDTQVSGNILPNDSDPDGDPLTVTNINFGGTNYPIVVGTPTVVTLAEGILTINSDGTFTFDPTPGFNGPVPIGTYTIIDGNGGSATANLIITVNPVNDPPVAQNNSYTTPEDTPILTANVLNDAGPLVDSDPDGDILTVTSFVVGGISYPAGATVTIPGVGVVTIYSNGLMNFTPAANFAGPVPTIPYTISDGNGGTSTANIDITVTPINDPPVAIANYATTYEDTPVTIPILGNDTDLDGTLNPATIDLDPSTPGIDLSYTVAGQGTFVVDPATGIVTFTPVLNFNGAVTPIIYQVCDNGTPLPALCDTAYIYVNVLPVNDPPVVVGITTTTPEDTPITICRTITDVDPGSTFTSFVCGNPSNGTISYPVVTGNQVCVTYTPNPGFNGTDNFCIQVCDNGAPQLCDTAMYTINIAPVNDPPVANADFATTPEDTPVNIAILGNDTDLDGTLNPATIDLNPSTPGIDLTYTVAGQGTFVVDPLTGIVTFTPVLNFNGVVTPIIYQVCDNGTPLPALCDTAYIHVTVTPVNDPPVVVGITTTTPEDTPITICRPITDVDAGSTFTANMCGNPSNGTVSTPIVTGNTVCVTYTPNPNFNGTDVFCIQICDNGSPVLCDTAIYTINVAPVNDPPVANADFATTPEDTPVNIAILGNDTDLDGTLNPATIDLDPSTPSIDLTYTVAGQGTFVVDPLTGIVTFTPVLNFNGVVTPIIYQVCDNGTPLPALCDTAYIHVTVTPVNDPPVVVGITTTTPEDTPITICRPITDVDAGSTFTANMCGNPSNGTVSTPIVTGNTVCVTYTPNPNFNGTDVFCIQICDNGSPVLCDTAIYTINVAPVNDPPVANADFATTPEDTPVTIAILGNDTDLDGTLNPATIDLDPSTPGIDLTYTVAGQGTFVVDPLTGIVTFTPVLNFNGVVTPIIYQVCDNGTPLPALCDTAYIHVTVTPVNDPPVVVGITTTTPEDTPITICRPITDVDAGSTFTANMCGNPSNGTVSTPIVTGNTVCVTYTPNPNFNGTDVFCIQICDNGSPVLCDTAIYTINVAPVNDPPVANADFATTPEDTPVNITILGNDTDLDGTLNPATIDLDPSTPGIDLTYTVAGQGTFVVDPLTGIVTFTPVLNFNGVVTPIIYQVCDNGTPLPALCDTAYIHVTVTPVNDPPVAVYNTNTTPEDTPVSGNVAGNDYDVDGNLNPNGFSLITGPTNGTLVFNPNGTYTYTPNPNYNGPDTFIYQVCDLGMPIYCDTAIVYITILPVNDPPVTFNEEHTICSSDVASGNIFNGDVDPDGTALTVGTIVQGPSSGTFTILPSGAYSYTPVATFGGVQTIVVALCDAGIPMPSLCTNDTITIHVSPQVFVNAGADATICETTSYTLSGATVQNAASIYWTTSGSGYFNNDWLVNPTYVPSAADIIAGSVTLTMNVNGIAPCSNKSDAMVLTINRQPVVNAGPDATICETAVTYTLSAATAQYGVNYLWSTSGTGTFSSTSAVNPIYTPSLADITAGSVTLTLSATALAPCVAVSDQMILHISRQAIVAAGPDATICETGTFTLSAATAQYTTSLLWTTSGTGTFSNPTAVNPVYTPSPNDILDGYVNLTITGTSAAPCATPVSDVMRLNISRQAIVDAGPNALICETEGTYTIVGSSAQFATSYLWTTSGTGTFANATLLHPVYTPSAADIAAGNVTLTVVATSAAPCVSVTDNMILNISRQAIVDAGPDGLICETGSFVISGSTSQYATGYMWTTSGTGTFNNPASLHPTYTPSDNDILDGYVELTVTATSAAPCVPVSSTMTLNISRQPIAFAGEDDIICQGTTTYQITGASAQHYTSLQWTHTGLGTLQNANTINPTYVPLAYETGNVIFTLTAIAAVPCENAVDQMLLTILPAPEASAGIDDTICEGQNFPIVTSYASYYSSLMWTTSGTGTFSDPTILHPVYIPSNSDVLNGFVTLTLESIGNPPCGSAFDQMNLIIDRAPVSNAGPDDATCQGMPYTVSQASAMYYTSLLWSHNGQGTLTDATTLTPTYTPAVNETGVVILTLTATGTAACGSVSNSMNLTIHPKPVANAGYDAANCDVTPFTLVSASASGVASIMWTTSGTGTFNNPNMLNATYTPTPADILNGNVLLVLTVQGLAPCGSSSDTMNLILNAAPMANAGPDASTCSSSSYTVSGASITGASVIQWTHNGTGNLIGANSLTPTYVPAPGESGVVVLTMTVTGNAPCGQVSDQMNLTISPEVILSAGADISTCETSAITISGASAQNYASILWTTNGSGTFNNPTAVNPVYTPSVADANVGMIVLTMTVNGVAPCGSKSDQVTLTLVAAPTAFAGPSVSTCQGVAITINEATASNYSTLLWSFVPSNAGTLTNAGTITPTFTPNAGFNGDVTLTLSATGSTACANVVATSTVVLTVNKAVAVNAGVDQTIPAGSVTNLFGSATGGSGFYAWSWTPSNLLENSLLQNPTTLALNEATEFTLTVLDLSSGCAGSDNVMIVLGNANRPPVAIDDYDTTLVNTSTTIKVLVNDSDPDGDPLTVSFCGYPSHGIVVLNSDNTFTYTPYPDYKGDDVFCYYICDNGSPALCDTAMVYIHIKDPRMDDLEPFSGFTPNGDGKNDIWTIRGIEDYPDNEVLIFNRWGDKIREFYRYDNKNVFWDSTNDNGNPVPDGTYFYILKVKNVGTRTGWIFIRGGSK